MTSDHTDPADFQGRMEACAAVIRQRLAQGGGLPTARDPAAVQALMEAVREALYRDYSLWNNEAEYVERLITRALSGTPPDAAA